jgi:hypothetical protein
MRKILLHMMALACLSGPALAAPATITLADKNIFPESMTATPDNTVIVGSMLQPFIYRALPGALVATRWIDLTSVSSTSWGVLADVKSNTLWTCTIMHPLTDTATPPMKERHSTLRSFDLRSGAPKGSYPLLGPINACNDITVAPDGTVYVSDLANGQIQRLKLGATAMDVWLKSPEVASIDGIAFLGPVLYTSNVQTGHMYRIPIGADGAAGAPVDIALSQPLGGPDGVRAWNGKLYVAENRNNQVSELTFNGDSATVKVLKGGYQTATGVAPTRDTIWVEESKQNYWRAPLLGTDPNPFIIQPMPMPK